MTSLPDGTHILARVKDGDTWKLQYMDVSVDLSSSAGNLISADSEVTSLSSNSIQAVETDDGTSAIAFQLYDFEKGGSTQSLPSELSGWSILARCRDNGVSELKYVEASAMSHPVPDSTVDFLMQKSVDKAEADGKEILQLHDFGTDGKALDISFSQDSTTLSDGIEILARQVQDDGTRELRYAKMSISFGNLRELSADTEEAESATKSIDCDSNVLKLHDFNGTSRSVSLKLEDTTSGKQIPGDVSLLVRKDNELKYANLEIEFPDLSSPEAFEQLSGHFIADSASDLGISSVQEVEKGGKKVFSAWQFGDRDFHMPRESAAKASDIIIRDRDSMQLKYVEMSSLALDTDSSIAAAGTKSVEAAVLTSDFGSAPVLRLHGFNDAEATSAEISVSLNGSWEQEVAELPGEFLVRTTLEDGSQELQY